MSAEEIKAIEDRMYEVVNDHIKYPELMEKYAKWADIYEQDMTTWGYKSPDTTAAKVKGLLGDNKDARILDVCAGTGMAGQTIFDAGYKNIEAFDGNAAMLEKAKPRNIYKTMTIGYLGDPIKLPDNSFDMVTLVGGLCPGHVTAECFGCFRELTRIIKPGGYYLANIGKVCLTEEYSKGLQDAKKALVDEGVWEEIENKVTLVGDFEDYVWIYRIK